MSDEKETTNHCSQSADTHADEGGIPVSDEEDNALEADQTHPNTRANISSLNAQNESEQSALTQVVDEMSIAGEITNYIHVNRINLGELDNSIDMWAICDAISAAHSGLPDSLLRAAFLLVLDGSHSFAQNNPWMRTHIDQLSRVWKREMLSEKSTNRPTKFVSSSAVIASPKMTSDECVVHSIGSAAARSLTGEEADDHQQKEHGQPGNGHELPPSAVETLSSARRQRRQFAKRKRALAVMMGVGQMLQQARRTLTTETGHLDVDEDEFGNFSIGGTELTFESWGKLNAITQSDIVHIDEQQQQQEQQQQLTAKRYQDGSVSKQQNGQVEQKANKMEKLRQSLDSTNAAPEVKRSRRITNDSRCTASATGLLEGMAERYPTVAEVEMPSPVAEDQRPSASVNGPLKKERKAAKLERKQKRLEEKDEGELSSSDSEEPTSSDEEEMGSSADETAASHQPRARLVAAREKRRVRRVDEQKQGVSSAQNLQALLRKCFELRARIVGKLTIGQKAMFRDCLNRSISGTLQEQPQQRQLQQLIHSMAKPISDGNGEMIFP